MQPTAETDLRRLPRAPGWIHLSVAAALLTLLLNASAAAQDPADGDCHLDADGVLVCPEMEVEGQLRQPPQVVVGRESLDPPVGDLGASFLSEIESSVEGEPF